MVTPRVENWAAPTAAFVLWAAATGSVVYWGLKLAGRSAPAVAAPVAARAAPTPDPTAVARLLGASPAAAAPGQGPAAAPTPVATLASRFSLVGVAAGARSGGGAALISIDGQPAKPFRVGSQLDEGIVLQSVQGRRAVLAATPRGPALLTLELPPPRQ